ncbi:hypothetical protein MASR1M12_10610 [Erysipelotrichia bacterium]
MLFDRLNPLELIENLKTRRFEASMLVHVEGTRSSAFNQPVTRISSIFFDMAIEKDMPLVPVCFVGGLPGQPSEERFDFPFKNGKWTT